MVIKLITYTLKSFWESKERVSERKSKKWSKRWKDRGWKKVVENVYFSSSSPSRHLFLKSFLYTLYSSLLLHQVLKPRFILFLLWFIYSFSFFLLFFTHSAIISNSSSSRRRTNNVYPLINPFIFPKINPQDGYHWNPSSLQHQLPSQSSRSQLLFLQTKLHYKFWTLENFESHESGFQRALNLEGLIHLPILRCLLSFLSPLKFALSVLPSFASKFKVMIRSFTLTQSHTHTYTIILTHFHNHTQTLSQSYSHACHWRPVIRFRDTINF